ncbi:hypothetical protein BGX33_009550 [Mortierella sp. NVP41]|nr:hypothetical protein BGX33_009550 [Mortierella sp. NVP41]
MGHRQWRHPRCSFVLNPRAEHDEAFSRLRCRVEEVEWSNADTQAVGYERLVPIIRSMPNLKRLSLTTTESQQDQNGAFISLLQDENKLTKLRSLDLDLQRFEGQDRIPIRDLFSRLETLYELGINGPWYSGATSAELEQVRQGRPWRLQSLKTPRTDLSLLSVCPELRRLELTAMPSQTEESALAPILACTKLEELCFTGRTAFNIADWGRVLFRLHALITLSITLGHPSDFRRLRPLRYDHFAPSLKKLVVDLDRGMSGGAQPTLSLEDHTMLASILFARDALTAFVLRGFDLEHRYLRTTFEMLGKNTFHRLEELRLEISVPQPDDVRRQREIWQNIYGLLANLRIVHTLTLRCRDLDKTPESGIHLLGRATHLRHLSLMDPGRQAWTSLEVANLMNTVSTLEALDLRPLTARNHSQVNSWLVASGKRQLCF